MGARDIVGLVARAIEVALQGAVAAMLPSPERERFARPREIDAPRWSLEIGLLQGAAGAGLFMAAGLAYTRPATTDQALILLRNWWPGLSTTHFQSLGLINWLGWCLSPASWPFTYLALVGLLRCTAFAIAREAVGEPVVWAAIRTYQHLRRVRAARSREARLGPLRPDRVLRGKGTDVLVLTCRDKPEWTPTATIEIGDRFYRLLAVRERQDGEWSVIVYGLREQEPQAVVRGLVHYRPPAGTHLPEP